MKIKIVKTDWFLNEDTGTTVCKLKVQYNYENESKIIKDLLNNSVYEFLSRSDSNWDYNRYIEKTFIGKSTVMEGDEYNTIKGERIAEAKAKLKAFECLKRLLTNIDLHLINQRYSIIDVGEKAKDLISREEKHLNELVK